MARSDRPVVAGRPASAPALAPPWAAPVAVVALLVGSLLAGLVWHATRLDPVDSVGDALAGARPLPRRWGGGDRAPAPCRPVTLMTMVAGAALAWLAGRRDAVVLALAAAPATLAAEMLLKQLVHRQWNGDPDLLFPSGHVAVATAAAMTAVLVLRVVPVARTRPCGRRLPGRRLRAGHRRRAPGGDGAPADRRPGRRRHRAGGDPRRGVGDHDVAPAGSSPGVLDGLVEVADPPAARRWPGRSQAASSRGAESSSSSRSLSRSSQLDSSPRRPPPADRPPSTGR